MGETTLNNLPPNWSWVKLGDVSEIVMGQSPPSSTYNTDQIGLPFFQGKAEFTELYPVVRKWCSEPNKVAEPLDILISVRAPVGSSNIANQKRCIGRGLAALRYPDCNKYIFYYFRLIEQKLDELGTGSTFKAISSATLRNVEIPLPPLPEQKKIVEKIEELFSGLDSGVASLKKAEEQIRLYRQSVLASAFSGKLLTQIAQRQAHSEMLKAAEPRLDYSNQLQTGWKWVKFNDFCKLQRGYDLPLKNILEGKYPVVTSGGINGYHKEYKAEGPCLVTGRSGSVGNIHFIDIDYYWPHNTVLYVKDFCHNMPKFIYYYFRQFNFKKFSSSTAVPTLDRKKMYNEQVMIPTLVQQIQIVEEIEKRFSEADNLEKAIDESLVKSETLRQSILKKAFEGKLV